MDNGAHWDAAYAAGVTSRSWYHERPQVSLDLLSAAGVGPADSVVDVGGGASPLADSLLSKGFTDVTVVDISAVGLQCARDRLGADADRVTWICADIRSWQPGRRFRAWHDRAVFHFLVEPGDQETYLRTLDASAEIAIFGTFGPDGPQTCSGLPVARYSAADLGARIGPQWTLISARREEHQTPAGAMQPFTWAAFRRAGTRSYGTAK